MPQDGKEDVPDPRREAAAAPAPPGVPIRPPRLYLGALALGIALGWIWPLRLGLEAGGRAGLGAAGVLGGLGLAMAAMDRFRRAGTDVPVDTPAQALVTGGVYRLSRNPIYLGMTLIYAGLAAALDSLWVAGLLAPVLLIMRCGVIAREERYLAARFGPAYDAYRRRVRRWI